MEELIWNKKIPLSTCLIHGYKLRTSIQDIDYDIKILGKYFNTWNMGKLSPEIIDPIYLRRELSKIQKKLAPTLALPEDPNVNFWHLYTIMIDVVNKGAPHWLWLYFNPTQGLQLSYIHPSYRKVSLNMLQRLNKM